MVKVSEDRVHQQDGSVPGKSVGSDASPVWVGDGFTCIRQRGSHVPVGVYRSVQGVVGNRQLQRMIQRDPPNASVTPPQSSGGAQDIHARVAAAVKAQDPMEVIRIMNKLLQYDQ